MEEKNIQVQIDALDKKMDLILEYVNQQRLKSIVIDDLVSDLSIIGKDAFDSTVEELDKRQVEIDPSELTDLAISMVRNIGNFKMMMGTFEMAVDLSKEIGPIANEALIDFTKSMGEFEKKGYFAFIKEIVPIMDNIVAAVTPQDMHDLADNIVLILTAVKDITQPKMLKALDNAVNLYSSVDAKEVPSYSVWRLLREMNSPEMKKAIGFAVTFLKNMSESKDDLTNHKNN